MKSWWIDEEPYPGPPEKSRRQEMLEAFSKMKKSRHAYGLAFDVPSRLAPSSAMRTMPSVRHVDVRHTAPAHHPYIPPPSGYRFYP